MFIARSDRKARGGPLFGTLSVPRSGKRRHRCGGVKPPFQAVIGSRIQARLIPRVVRTTAQGAAAGSGCAELPVSGERTAAERASAPPARFTLFPTIKGRSVRRQTQREGSGWRTRRAGCVLKAGGSERNATACSAAAPRRLIKCVAVCGGMRGHV